MKLLICITILLGTYSLSTAQRLSSIVENGPSYENIELSSEIILSRKTTYQPAAYHLILLQSDAPDEMNQNFIRLLNNAGFNALQTKDIFTEPRTYSVVEIDSLIKAHNIDLYLRVGYTSQKINTGISNDLGKLKVNLRIELLDIKNPKEPFYIINGSADGSKNADLTLSEEVFWRSIRELIDRNLIYSY